MKHRVGLICSAGGHLAQLHWLRHWWGEHDRFWVTFDTPDARQLLVEERTYWGHQPTNRHLGNLGRNTRLAWDILRREAPDVLVSNGAGLALPFFYVARALGIKLVFIEVYDRIDSPSLTGRLLRPVADEVVLQWSEQARFYPEGTVLGPIR